MTYTIRKLEWKLCDNHHEEYYHATGNVCDYTIVKVGNHFTVITDKVNLDFSTLQEAKDLAQGHFEDAVIQFLNVQGDEG